MHQKFNRKFASLLFALGIGAASAPVFAADCSYYCWADHRACLSGVNGPTPADVCDTFYQDCLSSCG